jgi:hypothetical protein
MRHRMAIYTANALAMATAGCGDELSPRAVSEEVVVETLYQGTQCPKPETDGQVFNLAESDLAAFLAKTDTSFGGPRRDPISVDSRQQTVIWVDVGSKPTAGYSLRLRADTAFVEGRTLLLPVEYLEPADGAMVAQVLTQPCLVVLVAAVDLAEVRLLDATLDTLAQGVIR